MTVNQHRKSGVSCSAAFLLALSCVSAFGAQPKKSPIVFSPAGGVYATNVSLTLSARAGSPTIRYTLDGSEPDETSPTYTTPLLISNITLVRAKAFPRTGPSTSIAAEVYTIIDEDLSKFSSNIPLLIVNSFGTNIVNEQKIEGALQFLDAGKERTALTSAVDFSGRSLLNLRGRASLRYPKSSFTVKLIDGDGDSMPASLLGLPADPDWVLYAPYPDKTLMRDVIAYELHEQMGTWAPRRKFIEVFVNQTGGKLSRNDYVGVYVLIERIHRAKQRVNIANLKPTDDAEPAITGGYIFKKDHIDSAGFAMGGEGFGAGAISQSTKAGYPTGPGGFPADPNGFQPASRVTRSSSSSSSRSSSRSRVFTNHLGFAATRIPIDGTRDMAFRDEYESVKEEEGFKTARTNEFFFVEPEQDELTAVQKVWLKRHLNLFEAALYGPDFRDAAMGYGAYIDADSFIDYHLIVETTKNVDGFRFSVFFTKERGEKIKAMPIWDWNLSFGNANGKQGWMTEYWLWPQLDNKEYSWYRRLFEDPDFGQRYVDRWSQLRTNVFATRKILARVDELAALLDESQKRNFEKWPIMGRPINPNYLVGATYEQEIAMLKSYIDKRLDWIEKQFPPVPGLAFKDRGQARAVELSVRAGEIYFTTDGTDPRASGGAASQKARVYKSPFPLEKSGKMFARVRQDNRWSGPLIYAD
jgi:hypothetical protein